MGPYCQFQQPSSDQYYSQWNRLDVILKRSMMTYRIMSETVLYFNTSHITSKLSGKYRCPIHVREEKDVSRMNKMKLNIYKHVFYPGAVASLKTYVFLTYVLSWIIWFAISSTGVGAHYIPLTSQMKLYVGLPKWTYRRLDNEFGVHLCAGSIRDRLLV